MVQRHCSGLVERDREPRQDGQVGVQPNSLNAAHAQRQQAALVLLPAERPLDGPARSRYSLFHRSEPRGMRVCSRLAPIHLLAGEH